MIGRADRLRGGEEGQTVVLVALAMPLFLALLLVVIDGGRLYVERERLIGAARLSAQAGTSALVSGGDGGRALTDAQVRAVALEAIARNLPGEAVRSSIDVDRPNQTVSVRLEEQVDAFFGRLSVPVAGAFVAGSNSGSPAITASPSGDRAAIRPTAATSAVGGPAFTPSAAGPTATAAPNPSATSGPPLPQAEALRCPSVILVRLSEPGNFVSLLITARDANGLALPGYYRSPTWYAGLLHYEFTFTAPPRGGPVLVDLPGFPQLRLDPVVSGCRTVQFGMFHAP